MKQEVMKQTVENITKNVRYAVIYELNEINVMILNRVNARATVLYSETADSIRKRFQGDKFMKMVRLRRAIFRKNNEDFEIVAMIQREIEKIKEMK